MSVGPIPFSFFPFISEEERVPGEEEEKEDAYLSCLNSPKDQRGKKGEEEAYVLCTKEEESTGGREKQHSLSGWYAGP